MKKYIATMIIVLLPFCAGACDICGCGVGGNYIGILPEFSKHIFGLRYRSNSLFTHIGTGGIHTYLTTAEKYRTTELWGGWNITRDIRVMASVPYNFNERSNQGVTTAKNGIGDISVLGFYQLVNRKRTVFGNKVLVQSLWTGAGIKLPTGTYNPADRANAQNANLFQLGTGSTDFTVNAMYDVRLQDAGINLSGSYKLNTTNKYEYSYGNKLSFSTQLYYKVNIKKTVTIAPNTGVLYENGQKDTDHKFDVDVSGGYLLLGTLGVEATFKKISAGANIQTPLSQNLAMGIVKANNRAMVHVALAL